MGWLRSHLSMMTIGSDKLNQLRHVRFFGNLAGIRAHMKKHAAILRPKFDAVDRILHDQLTGLGVASWNKPAAATSSAAIRSTAARRAWSSWHGARASP
jgi:DNA-binding transcriptional MocR family regulator